MPMTPDDRRNEHLKLLANWFNIVAAGIIGAGVFVPATQQVFHILPAETDNGLVVGIGVVCIVTGVGLHCIGQLFLGALR
jgi:hypothetical protein